MSNENAEISSISNTTDTSDVTLETIKSYLEVNQGLFLTGPAGTGKSTLIQQMKEDDFFNNTYRTYYLGSTGIAAYNIGGVTIHSFFKLNPFAESLEQQIERSLKVLKKRSRILKNVILVIDEISMVSNLLLDTIDFVLQKILNNKKSFGGLKIIFVGDFLQLPPVYSTGDCYPEDIEDYYDNYSAHKILGLDKLNLIPVKSCYKCKAWNNLNPKIIKLEKNYRFINGTGGQKEFIAELLRLRKGNYSLEYWSRYNKNKAKEDSTKLTALKKEAQSINEEELNKIKGKTYLIKYSIKDNKKISSDLLNSLEDYKNIYLKIGAKIILTKNLDISNGLVNGSVGEIVDIKYNKNDVIETNNLITLDTIKNNVILAIKFNKRGSELEEEKEEIKMVESQSFNISLFDNTVVSAESQDNNNKKKDIAVIKYFPVRLAWAITTHKSQGLTLDSVSLIGSNFFAPHQLYVALSRVRNPENLYIDSLPLRIPTIDSELLELYE